MRIGLFSERDYPYRGKGIIPFNVNAYSFQRKRLFLSLKEPISMTKKRFLFSYREISMSFFQKTPNSYLNLRKAPAVKGLR